MIAINGNQYEQVRLVLENQVNSIFVCSRVGGGEAYYTAIAVRDRDMRKEILKVAEGWQEKSEILELEAQQEALYLLFPNRRDRILKNFISVYACRGASCLTLCRRVVMESMALQLPYPLILLMMESSCINMDEQGQPYFNYYMDLSDYRPDASQADCVMALAELLEEWLRAGTGKGRKASEKALELISKKSSRKMHREFSALYKDLELASQDSQSSIAARLHRCFFNNRGMLYRILKMTALGCFLAALLVFLNQVLFSDLTLWFRYTGMEQIGTVMLGR